MEEGPDFMDAIGLSGAEWLAVLRIGLGLWWLESWRHKDKKGWFERGTGIAWAADVVEASTSGTRCAAASRSS